MRCLIIYRFLAIGWFVLTPIGFALGDDGGRNETGKNPLYEDNPLNLSPKKGSPTHTLFMLLSTLKDYREELVLLSDAGAGENGSQKVSQDKPAATKKRLAELGQRMSSLRKLLNEQLDKGAESGLTEAQRKAAVAAVADCEKLLEGQNR